MWVVYTVGGTTKVRIQKTDLVDETIDSPKGPLASAYPEARIGATGGGGYVLNMRLCEIMIWPGQALSPAQIVTREAYFKTRYPSLGL